MNKSKVNERGFVSIFAVLIIMTVLTLITVGFSAMTRDAEKRTLDNQLNTQAFYAAESGVNDAVRLLQATPAGSGGANKPTCQGATDDGRNLTTYSYDTALDVGYSCVLIDPTPNAIVTDSVPEIGVAEPYVTPFSPKDGSGAATVPSYLEFYWDSQNPTASLPPTSAGYGFNPDASPFLPPKTGVAPTENWGSKVGMLRVDLVQNNNLNRDALVNNGYTFFLYPTTDGTTVTAPILGPASNAVGVVPGTADKAGTLVTLCGTTPVTHPFTTARYRCRGRVYLYSNTATSYTLRLQSYYNPTRVIFTAFTAAGDNLSFADGPAVVDVTGRAKDVFRRIKEYVTPNAISGVHHSFALLSADSICKRLVSADGRTDIGDTDGIPPSASVQACKPDIL